MSEIGDKSVEQLWHEEARDKGMTLRELYNQVCSEYDAIENDPTNPCYDEEIAFLGGSKETLERMLHS